MSTSPAGEIRTIKSLVPARLDRLPWSRFHTLVVVALGITWVLDGLEITIANAVSTVWEKPHVFHLSAGSVSHAASVYLAGEVVGALFFGWLADRLGRRRLFIITLVVYMVFSAATAGSQDFYMVLVFRFLAGTGIGGEYAAINSAIDELIPARRRGFTDLCINGTYWLGSAIGSAVTIPLLSSLLPTDLGWRLAFLVGPAICILIIPLRRHLPESPRWLMTHGREEEAEATVARIEERIRRLGHDLPDVDEDQTIEVHPRKKGGATYREIARIMFRDYPDRSGLSLTLFITQSFLYNAIFFTYSLLLKKYYGISSGEVGYYLFYFAAGNLLGPFVLGRLFDSIGRKRMISITYISSGVLLAITGWLFRQGALNATDQTILWAIIFFIASAAASSAYLTTSEIFPLELRSRALAFFFAIGQLVGGVAAPSIFGSLIGTGNRKVVFIGYLVGAILMVIGGLVEIFVGVSAERKSLEEVASPLSAVGPGPGRQQEAA